MVLYSELWPTPLYKMQQEQAPAKRIKRTSFSPWSSGVMGSSSKTDGPATPKAAVISPEPPRIVSDLSEQATQRVPSPLNGAANKVPPTQQATTGMLAKHPKIVDMQQQWEKGQKAAGSPGGSPGAEASAGGGQSQAEAPPVGQKQPSPAMSSHAAAVSASQRKRPSPDKPSSEPPSKKPQTARQSLPVTQANVQESAKIKSSVRAEARRFTEAEAQKHLAAAKSASTVSAPSFLSSVAKKAPLTVPKDSGTPLPKKATLPALSQGALSAPKKSETTPPNLPKKVEPAWKNTVPASKSLPPSLPKKVEPPTPQTTAPPSTSTSTSTSTSEMPPQLVSTESVRTSGKSAPKVGEPVVSIPIAEGDRLYSLFPTADGVLLGARGALIPKNYKMHDDPDLPYICPVRDCRRLFPSLKGLGGHFSAGHCTITFNDNGDGTLSKVGSYTSHGSKGAPGIVVSRNPLPPNAPPPADPGLSYFASHKTQTTRPSLGGNDSDIESEVRDYLHRFLATTQKTYRREDVRYMINLQRKRNLPDAWIQYHQNSDLDVTHYACALAYLIGEEVIGEEECDAQTRFKDRPTSRLSTPCIRLPSNMHAAAQKVFSTVPSCVGCRYWSHLQRQKNRCDWSPDPKLSRSQSAEDTKKGIVDVKGPDSKVEETIEDEDEDEEVVREVRQTRRRFAAPAPVQTPVPVPVPVKVLPPAAPAIMGNNGLANTSGQFSGSSMEMEEWEVAPGRVMDGAASNIAYSNSYLTSGQPVTVSEDVSFNVLVVKPGSVSHWSVEDDKLRTVSVAAGKVIVTMSGKTYRLGPNGMFIVRPGQACKVENRLYIDSVMHCTTIADF
ncbi:hypothetical protein QQX98_007370 [Neonectria punicea]|uniref:C2H2-type domain-containing protein n=1 Tax=Neonectria punicea TaxID=979145 RepID=A0ABR1GY37_9HYPO